MNRFSVARQNLETLTPEYRTYSGQWARQADHAMIVAHYETALTIAQQLYGRHIDQIIAAGICSTWKEAHDFLECEYQVVRWTDEDQPFVDQKFGPSESEATLLRRVYLMIEDGIKADKFLELQSWSGQRFDAWQMGDGTYNVYEPANHQTPIRVGISLDSLMEALAL